VPSEGELFILGAKGLKQEPIIIETAVIMIYTEIFRISIAEVGFQFAPGEIGIVFPEVFPFTDIEKVVLIGFH
jgi:hypothetical protein